eukprot:1663082-Pyramimonas_sp.AAC.2
MSGGARCEERAKGDPFGFVFWGQVSRVPRQYTAGVLQLGDGKVTLEGTPLPAGLSQVQVVHFSLQYRLCWLLATFRD